MQNEIISTLIGHHSKLKSSLFHTHFVLQKPVKYALLYLTRKHCNHRTLHSTLASRGDDVVRGSPLVDVSLVDRCCHQVGEQVFGVRRLDAALFFDYS